MNAKNSLLMIEAALLTVLVAGCTKANDKLSSSSTDKQPPAKQAEGASAAPVTTPAAPGGAQPATADASKPIEFATKPGGTTATAGTTGDASKTAATPDTANPVQAANGQIHLSMSELPESLVICTVGGSAITVADYKRALKLQQSQLQTGLTYDPNMRANLLSLAKQKNVTLSSDEKAKLISGAKAQHTDFAQFLKDKNINESEFDKQIAEAGVEFKAGEAQLESTLLPQLVSREVMVRANSGSLKSIEGNFPKFQKSQEYANLKSTTGMSETELKQEFVKAEMAKMQVTKLTKGINVSDKEVRKWYDQNRAQFKHGERVRISTILIAAPEQDAPGIKSLRTMIKESNPKLEGKDLDTAVTNLATQQQNKALILLGEGQAKGADFKKLADDNTQETAAHNAKNGGDMGWKEKTQLVPEFVAAIWSVKAGTVLPKLVKDGEGYRIVKVTGHEGSGVYSLAEVRPLAIEKLKQDKLNATVQRWVADQEHSMKIEFSPKFLAIANGKSGTH